MQISFFLKRFSLVVSCFITTSILIFGEDIISMRNGDIIKANIREISKTEIKYNKVSNPNGPLFVVDKNDVRSILYANGEQEIFEEYMAPAEKPGISNVKNKASVKNVKLINSINEATVTHDKTIGGIKNSNVTAIWGISENSILSDANLTFTFDKFSIGKMTDTKIERYRFKLTNDSPHAVYVDLTNSFFGNSTTGSSPFYKNKTYSQTSNSERNVGFNVGALSNALGVGGIIGTLANGISIGGGKSNGSMVSESESPILIIPPHSFTCLPCEKVLIDNEWLDMPYILYFYTKQLSVWDASGHNTFQYMSRSLDSKLKVDNSEVTATSIGLRKNSLVEFPPESSPKEYTIFLTYVLYGNTSNIYQMPIKLYLRGLFEERIEFQKSYAYSNSLIYGPAYILK